MRNKEDVITDVQNLVWKFQENWKWKYQQEGINFVGDVLTSLAVSEFTHGNDASAKSLRNLSVESTTKAHEKVIRPDYEERDQLWNQLSELLEELSAMKE